MKKQNIYIGWGLILAGLVAGYLWYSQTPVVSPTADLPTTPDLTDLGSFQVADYVNIPLAFTAQAPFGEWEDPRQQDACEEASIAIVKWWYEGKLQVSKDQAKAEILALSALSEKTLGTFHDTSATDTAKLLTVWVPGVEAEVMELTVERIEQALYQGKLIIVPTDGRLLGNPYFSGGGPERHMLVIKGYDREKQQFITHDVGTRQGADYVYSYQVLMNSLLDYGTGYHEPVVSTKKVGIVVSK
ncbi:MAG: C39 family peptidase [Patescibacteria group bacterium]